MADRVTSARERVRAHRQRRRESGLKLVQYWVPDVDSEAFKAQARQDCLFANGAEDEADVMAFIESHYEELFRNEPWDAPL